MATSYASSWSPPSLSRPTNRLRGSEKQWVYLRWLAICVWSIHTYYAESIATPAHVLGVGILSLLYASVAHSLAHNGKPLDRHIIVGLDVLVVAAMCFVSGGLHSLAFVYFYGIVLASAIRFGLADGFRTALISTLLMVGLSLVSSTGTSWMSTLLPPALSFFLLAGLSGMLAYERLAQGQRTPPERSHADRVLAVHRALVPLSLDDLLQQLTDELIRLVPCRGASVLLIDFQRRRTDRVASSEHFSIPPANELNAALTNGVLNEALEQGMVVLESGDAIRTRLQIAPHLQEWGQQNLAILRLQTQYPLGCLVLGDKKGSTAFDPADLQLLTLVAAEAAILIENAWELEDVRTTAQEHRRSIQTVISTYEQERKREVEEWHERFSSKLFQVIKDFRACQEVVGQRLPELKERIEHLAAELDVVAATGRNFSNELHPMVLEDSGLIEALREYVAWVQAQGAFTVTLQTSPNPPQLSNDTKLALFRVTQETLRNIRKHAHAQNVHIAFTQELSGVSLMIKDDGLGFDTEEHADGQYRLRYMRERVAAYGGALHVNSIRGQGTEIRVDFPTTQDVTPIKLTHPISST